MTSHRPHIICTVSNDLTYDQRMQRICCALCEAGYVVTLVGRLLPRSVAPDPQPFEQVRLHCRFLKGPLFYSEYNLRLFVYLLRARYDAVCSVDFDTLPAGCAATVLRGKKRVFDAHEYFTEVPELQGRTLVRFVWGAIGRLCLLFYRHAYTVGPALADIFSKKYHFPFGVVRNVPEPATPPEPLPKTDKHIVLYQGALNAGRGIEAMLQAMRQLDNVEFWLAGEGDLSQVLRQMATELQLNERVRFLGYVKPAALRALTAQAWLGLNLLENKGLSYYYSLANKFFDSVQACVPVLTMDFPEYRRLNEQHEVAVMLSELSPECIATAVRKLSDQPETYKRLQEACLEARKHWNWATEKEILLNIWAKVLPPTLPG